MSSRNITNISHGLHIVIVSATKLLHQKVASFQRSLATHYFNTLYYEWLMSLPLYKFVSPPFCHYWLYKKVWILMVCNRKMLIQILVKISQLSPKWKLGIHRQEYDLKNPCLFLRKECELKCNFAFRILYDEI
jgi:hypothetical protein